MSTTSHSFHAILLEQTTRTSTSSKTRIKELIEESESKIWSLDSQIAVLLKQFDREYTTAAAKATALRWIIKIKELVGKRESKIGSLKTQIAVLFKQRDCEWMTAAALHSIIAPVHTLPVELLATVFLLTLSRKSTVKDAFRVSHVCSHWRRVAECTLQLWQGPIEIKDSKRPEDMYVDGLKTWLARSAPLCIHVRIYTSLPTVLEEVQRIAPRLSSLVVGNRVPYSFFRRLAEYGVDNLAELDLQRLSASGSDCSTISLGPAPRLRKLTLNSDVAENIRIPWHQLSRLISSSGGRLDLVLRLLARCKNLTMASVTVGRSGRAIHMHVRNGIALQRLRKLRLHFTGTSLMAPFLDCTSAPKLQTLYVAFAPRIMWAAAQFTAFQLRSPNITVLALGGANLTSADLRLALLHAPLLTQLILKQCTECMDDILFAALSYTEAMEPLVPQLRVLKLREISGGEYFSQQALADMIASRWWVDSEPAPSYAPLGAARWADVQLEWAVRDSLTFNNEFVDRMQDLGRQGLCFTVKL
ncbi:hypothetical protein DFH06DRAFT_1302467 [Mycena polygramma]|nr:hypothetical protein DFH06DRAFT_1302467 [Mycena polygramma]